MHQRTKKLKIGEIKKLKDKSSIEMQFEMLVLM